MTLGLAYAQLFPSRVTEMVLVSCTMTRPGDVYWLYHEAGRFFPAMVIVAHWAGIPGASGWGSRWG